MLLAPWAPAACCTSTGRSGAAVATRRQGNRAFDASLQAQNPSWGIRDLETVLAASEAQGFVVRRIVDMPANNLSLVLELHRQ